MSIDKTNVGVCKNAFNLNSLKNSSSSTIAIGFSASALPLLLRLYARNHTQYIFLTAKAYEEIESPPEKLLVASPSEIISQNWHSKKIFIFIGAIGAVVRLISPFINSKDQDPAVLVLDSDASNVVPLLGGHSQGADQIASDLAEDLGCKTIFTNDSKTQGRLPLDDFGRNWGWIRKGFSKDWRQLMIESAVSGNIEIIQETGSSLWKNTDGFQKLPNKLQINNPDKISSFYIGSSSGFKCSWHPACIWIGIGCERNSSASLIARSIKDSLLKARLEPESVAGLATIQQKFDEDGIISFALKNKWATRFYGSFELSKVIVPNPSKVVEREMGTSSVAEAACLLAARQETLLLKKQKFLAKNHENGAVTIAIAESVMPFAPNRGELHLIGSGPGDIGFLTSDARLALSRSAVWIGYGKYLDQLETIRRPDQVRLDGFLTGEKERCSQALQLAQEGVRISLVSSGDSGIYGMAGLALELLLELPIEERPLFHVHPGISAFQMAAAKIGAPLMQDFCAISLSDLLVDWGTIEKRLLSAAKGDFVIALYNPRSHKRDWQLTKAIDILLEFRESKTPVLIARQLSRNEEEIELQTLSTLTIEKVDMLTLIIIGNSSSFVQDGLFVTPRGYCKN